MIKVVTSLPEDRIKRYNIMPPEGFHIEYIKYPYTDQELIQVAKDADFLFLSLSPASRNVIKNLKKLKLIQAEGSGYDGIDLEAAREAGIYVCNARGVNKGAVAEHTIGLMLAALRRTVEADNELKRGNFVLSYKEYEEKGMKELSSCHVGIIGLGDIGIEVVKRLKPFNSKISYYNRTRKSAEVEKELGIDYLSLEEIYRQCDIISLHIPLTNSTRNLINKEIFNIVKRDSILINTARGEIINQEDLAAALIEGKIECAAIDTLSPQPPSKDHPLLNLPDDISKKLILTPHIAGITTEAFSTMQVIAWENMEKVLNGQRPENIVNDL